MGLGIPIIGDLIDSVGDLISEAIPDKDKRMEIDLELAKLADEANARAHLENMGQIAVNETEAKHGSLFVAGWRPFAGWVGGFALAYSAIVYPLLSWGSRVAGYTGDLPVLDNTLVMTIMMGMLGLGAQRSWEKGKGVSTNDYTDVPKADADAAPAPVKKSKRFLGIKLPENAPWA